MGRNVLVLDQSLILNFSLLLHHLRTNNPVTTEEHF